MARPTVSYDSVLEYVFHPRKAPKPVGLRATTLALTKGRRATRVRSFNRMKPERQALLRLSGQREAYLRGETSFRDALLNARVEAVGKGITKPRYRDEDIARHITDLAERESHYTQWPVSYESTLDRVKNMPPDMKRRAMALRSYDDLYGEATSDRNVIGQENMFWYK